MKKFPLLAALAATLLAAAGTADAANAPVNIAFPLIGASLNHLDPVYFSFTTTCPIGTAPSFVKWAVSSSTAAGNTTFCGTAGVHFAYMLPPGIYTFTASSSCGVDTVQFKVY